MLPGHVPLLVLPEIHTMDTFHHTLANLIERYVCLETQIQKLTARFSRQYCRECSGACCRDEICKESIQSPFLSTLVGMQKIRYHPTNGWQSAAGCRLDFGRPLVCHEYFCEEIVDSENFQNARIQDIIHRFVSIGSKARGNTHLLCIADLDILSPRKIDNFCDKIGLLLDEIAQVRSHSLPTAATGQPTPVSTLS
jgi:hypothetical protein